MRNFPEDYPKDVVDVALRLSECWTDKKFHRYLLAEDIALEIMLDRERRGSSNVVSFSRFVSVK